MKPDALSRQFSDPERPRVAENILPTRCLVGAVSWGVERKVQQALQKEPSPENCPANCLFVPRNVCSEVLQWSHSSSLACHAGVRRTMACLRQRFWWPKMVEDVCSFIAACVPCAQNKSSNQPPVGLLQPLPIPKRPWSHIALDFVTGLPPSDGNTTFLTIVDRFSKSVHFVPLPKLPSAKETAVLVVNHVFRIHGLPCDVVSDRGPQFVFNLLEGVLQVCWSHH